MGARLNSSVLVGGRLLPAGTEWSKDLPQIPSHLWDGELPQPQPDASWTVEQLKAHADEHGVDLEGASKKDDIVAKLTN